MQERQNVSLVLRFGHSCIPLAGVFLTRGVIGANGGGISVASFLVGVEGTLEGKVPALVFLVVGSMQGSALLTLDFLA